MARPGLPPSRPLVRAARPADRRPNMLVARRAGQFARALSASELAED